MSEERREEILKAFEACVVRKGIANTTLADVAQEADQARSLVRYFIGNRDAMVSCLIERLLARGEAQLDALRNQKASITPEDLAELLLDHVFADATTNIVIIELWQMSLRDEALRARLASIYQRIVNEVSSLISSKHAHDRMDAAFAAVSMALGAALLRQMGLSTYKPSPLLASIVRVMKDF
ncbi:MAG: TetR/AcrR family transcriptional regulator [Ectothiorhodospiraceae bacterium]|nr:TetR/AcrR family transcriptional regulator [Ectothiorhodospiraceae bacterium]